MQLKSIIEVENVKVPQVWRKKNLHIFVFVLKGILLCIDVLLAK